mmetsp:Transcript_130207/g.226304  ORF Transcript_130207/g.226304 Transcript_130207/m.226304 type:complete len:250 (+) Transcript_130207:1096-1845(+)
MTCLSRSHRSIESRTSLKTLGPETSTKTLGRGLLGIVPLGRETSSKTLGPSLSGIVALDRETLSRTLVPGLLGIVDPQSQREVWTCPNWQKAVLIALLLLQIIWKHRLSTWTCLTDDSDTCPHCRHGCIELSKPHQGWDTSVEDAFASARSSELALHSSWRPRNLIVRLVVCQCSSRHGLRLSWFFWTLEPARRSSGTSFGRASPRSPSSQRSHTTPHQSCPQLRECILRRPCQCHQISAQACPCKLST